MARLTLLGTGTSDGIPMLGCSCPVCTSRDPMNTRLRTSAWLETEAGSILIDCGPDFRQQALQHGISEISAIVLTHHHADHIGGLSELRPLSRLHPVRVYASGHTCTIVQNTFSYIFSEKPTGGGLPRIDLQTFNGSWNINGLCITPLPVLHGEDRIHGFRIGDMAYITDASFIPESTFELLSGIRYLVINGLREKPHATHFSIAQACHAAARTSAQHVWITHICHLVDHAAISTSLPPPVSPGYDGLGFEFDENAGARQ